MLCIQMVAIQMKPELDHASQPYQVNPKANAGYADMSRPYIRFASKPPDKLEEDMKALRIVAQS